MNEGTGGWHNILSDISTKERVCSSSKNVTECIQWRRHRYLSNKKYYKILYGNSNDDSSSSSSSSSSSRNDHDIHDNDDTNNDDSIPRISVYYGELMKRFNIK